jgi:hypothetical protein
MSGLNASCVLYGWRSQYQITRVAARMVTGGTPLPEV